MVFLVAFQRTPAFAESPTTRYMQSRNYYFANPSLPSAPCRIHVGLLCHPPRQNARPKRERASTRARERQTVQAHSFSSTWRRSRTGLWEPCATRRDTLSDAPPAAFSDDAKASCPHCASIFRLHLSATKEGKKGPEESARRRSAVARDGGSRWLLPAGRR